MTPPTLHGVWKSQLLKPMNSSCRPGTWIIFRSRLLFQLPYQPYPSIKVDCCFDWLFLVNGWMDVRWQGVLCCCCCCCFKVQLESNACPRSVRTKSTMKEPSVKKKFGEGWRWGNRSSISPSPDRPTDQPARAMHREWHRESNCRISYVTFIRSFFHPIVQTLVVDRRRPPLDYLPGSESISRCTDEWLDPGHYYWSHRDGQTTVLVVVWFHS